MVYCTFNKINIKIIELRIQHLIMRIFIWDLRFNQKIYCISVYTLNHFKGSGFTVLNVPNNSASVATSNELKILFESSFEFFVLQFHLSNIRALKG